jgi:hypothetical protein
MQEERIRARSVEAPHHTPPTELPLPVVPDWDEQVRHATQMTRLIDRHLDYEAYSRSLVEAEQLTPRRLCPEQRVNLITDMVAITRG